MNGDYLVIDKKVLPEVYEKVIATKKILQEGKVKEITERLVVRSTSLCNKL